jgi:hypothetical protein
VWLNRRGAPAKFQLCYDKLRVEKALTWAPTVGFSHETVDTGESGGVRYKETPILIADGRVNAKHVADLFALAGQEIPPKIFKFVLETIKQHPGYGDRA